MYAPAPGSSGPPGPPGSGPARVNPLAAREAALAACDAAAAGLAQCAQGLAAWAQVRLQVAVDREAAALQQTDAAEQLKREYNASVVHLFEERDRLIAIRDRLAEKEDELMRRESALQLVLEHPPHPFPFIDPDTPTSVYSPFYSPVPSTPPPPNSADDSDPLA